MGVRRTRPARRRWLTRHGGRWPNRRGGPRESCPALERHVRTTATGERAPCRGADAGRTGGADRHTRTPQRLSLVITRRADPSDRSAPRHGEAAVQGSSTAPDATLALVARQLSLSLLP